MIIKKKEEMGKNIRFEARKSKKLLLILIPVTLLSFLIIILNTNFTQDQLKNILESQIEENIESNISFKEFEIDYLSSIKIEGLKVHESDSLNSDVLIYIDQMEIEYNIYDLLFQGQNIDRVKLEGLLIDLDRTKEGELEIPSLDEEMIDTSGLSYETLADLPVSIDQLEIQNFQILYDDDFIPLDMKFSNLTAKSQFDETLMEYDILLKSDSIVISYQKNEYAISDIYFNASIDKNIHLVVDSLSASAMDFALTGKLSTDLNDGNAEFYILGNPSDLFSQLLPEEFPITTSPIKTRADINFKRIQTNPNFEIDIGFPEFSINDFTVSEFAAKSSFKQNHIILNRLSFNTMEGNISASGSYSLDSVQSYQLQFQLSDLEIHPDLINNYLEYAKLESPLHLKSTFNLFGRLSDLSTTSSTGTFLLESEDKKIINSTLSLNAGLLKLRSANALLNINSKSILTDEKLSGNLEMEIESIKDFVEMVSNENVDGNLFVKNNFSVSPKSLWVKSKTFSSGFYYDNIELLDTLTAELSYSNKSPRIDRMSFSGSFENLSPIFSQYNIEGVSGNLYYKGEFSGEVENPTGNITVHSDSIRYSEYNISNYKLLLSLNDKKLNIDNSQFDIKDLEIGLSGGFNFNDMTGNQTISIHNNSENFTDSIFITNSIKSLNDIKLNGFTNKLRLQHLNEFLPYIKFQDGFANSSLNIKKSDDDLKMDLPFSVDNIKLNELEIAKVSGSVKFDDELITADSIIITMDDNDYFLSASYFVEKDNTGNYSIDWENRLTGWARGNNFDLNTLEDFLPEYIDVNGHYDYDLTWDGPLLNPGINGFLRFEEIDFEVDSISVINNLDGEIYFRDSLVLVNNLGTEVWGLPINVFSKVEKLSLNEFDATLQVDLDNEDFLEFKAFTDLDSITTNVILHETEIKSFNALSPLLDDIEGKIYSEIDITGELLDPEIYGGFYAEGISYPNGFMDQQIDSGNVAVNLFPNQIILDNFFIKLNDGRITSRGRLAYNDGEIVDLSTKVQMDNIRVQYEKDYDVMLRSSNIKFESVDDRYLLSGKTEFGKSEINRDVETGEIWDAFVARTEKVLEGPKDDDPLDLMQIYYDLILANKNLPAITEKIDFDLAIENSDSIKIDNNFVDLTASPDIALRGSFYNPYINGRVTVLNPATITFLDREFDIKSGNIYFSDPTRINPIINIMATTEVEAEVLENEQPQVYKITLEVTGPLEDFDHKLTSEPVLDQGDIASILTLGLTTEDIQKGGSSNELITKRAKILATKQLSNEMSRLFDSWLGDIIELDHIGVGGNIFDIKETRFEITKRWSDQVEISYSTAIDRIDKQKLRAKVKLNKYFYLEGDTDQEAESGVDLIFRIKF